MKLISKQICVSFKTRYISDVYSTLRFTISKNFNFISINFHTIDILLKKYK